MGRIVAFHRHRRLLWSLADSILAANGKAGLDAELLRKNRRCRRRRWIINQLSGPLEVAASEEHLLEGSEVSITRKEKLVL